MTVFNYNNPSIIRNLARKFLMEFLPISLVRFAFVRFIIRKTNACILVPGFLKRCLYWRDSSIRYIRVFNVLRHLFDHNALWSAPRSGNHWLRYIAEYLTACPTCGHNNAGSDRSIFMNQFSSQSSPLAHVDWRSAYVLYKSHTVYDLSKESTLLLLVRDFHEYLAMKELPSFASMRENSWQNYFSCYLGLLRAYDSFTGTKMILYYEDLILKPEREILRIKNFLGASEVRYKTFMSNYEDHVKFSRSAKNRGWLGSRSGRDLKFHQRRVDKEEVERRLKLFHAMLDAVEYQRVKPYIARYL